MEDLFFDQEDREILPDDTGATASRTTIHRQGKKRSRLNVACDNCRERRSKCDGLRPSCTYCHNRGRTCHYQNTPPLGSSKTEAELAAINKRLDHLTNLLSRSQAIPASSAEFGESHANNSGLNDQDDSPFKLLGRGSMLQVLGLGAEFAEELLGLERCRKEAQDHPSRFFIVQHQQALSALAAFSALVHVWYPILRPGFSEQYLQIISGRLHSSPKSCLALLVAAIGSFAQHAEAGMPQGDRVDDSYFELALSALPAVISQCSVISVQCLILFSIYYCCLMRPCHAHDYAVIASFKVQDLLKRPQRDDAEAVEHLRRAYWTILLLESELNVQFDFTKSGIWSLDELMPLPDSRRTWEFSLELGSPVALSTSPASMQPSPSTGADKVQSYFLAEIAMRRMLHRCNTAIRKTSNGQWLYAPRIAYELELQLEEWYNYLPSIIRFSTDKAHEDDASLRACSLTNFLRVQYHCCKISIYWPAVYQAIEDGNAVGELLDHCRRFFEAYIQLMPSILIAFEKCLVNRWTLFASIFMTSMATMKAMKASCLSELCSPELYHCLSSATRVSQEVVRHSPSLTRMLEILTQRISNDYETPV
ncbi:hypothetical protein PV11_04161 [Exophiala sideris]|uniref:Zn(2)-C6 fungal-type domain-containing protein n=1 Tax=Exophiala sideris TaxID=1016849 RepID=A0A0D1W019_9EURO|nr:hypothetical protein PV11_04161 [Exophiala sideris]